MESESKTIPTLSTADGHPVIVAVGGALNPFPRSVSVSLEILPFITSYKAEAPKPPPPLKLTCPDWFTHSGTSLAEIKLLIAPLSMGAGILKIAVITAPEQPTAVAVGRSVYPEPPFVRMTLTTTPPTVWNIPLAPPDPENDSFPVSTGHSAPPLSITRLAMEYVSSIL